MATERTRPDDLAAAAAVWNNPSETLEQVNARIHDGVALDQLDRRADGYVASMFRQFPYVRLPKEAVCLEIGSGTGYIMEALHRDFLQKGNEPKSICGLDIAEHMLARARLRLGDREPFKFLHYDGINIPVPDETVDFVYSVAALQHIPKPYTYNLFFETRRILRASGFAIFSLLSFRDFSVQEKLIPWRYEILMQITRSVGHWHYFYSRDELENVLGVGTGFAHVDVRETEGLWVCVHKGHLSQRQFGST